MPRFLVAVPAVHGHIYPAIAIAERAKAEGHDAAMLLDPHVDPRLSQLGIPLFGVQSEAKEVKFLGAERSQASRDHKAELEFHRDRIRGMADKVESIREVLRTFRPDAVAVENMTYPIAIACRLERVPHVAYASSVSAVRPPELTYQFVQNAAALQPDIAELFARFGLTAELKDFVYLSPHWNAVLTTRSFVGTAGAIPPRMALVGPSIRSISLSSLALEAELAALPRPLVYIAFGTRFLWQPALLVACARGVVAAGASVIISAGQLANDEAFVKQLPAGVIAREEPPQLTILRERADALITHGGGSSLMEAMYFGVPLIVIPLAVDQPLTGYLVERSGAGVHVERSAADEQTVERAVSRALRDPAIAQNVQRVSASYRDSNGALGIVRIMEGLQARGT